MSNCATHSPSIAPSATDSLVATIIGWRCCCDITLSRSDEDTACWAGSGHTGKDGSGYFLEIALTRPESPDYSLWLAITAPDGRRTELAPVADTDSPPGWRGNFHLDGFFGSPQSTDVVARDHLSVIVAGNAELKAAFRNAAFGLSYMTVVRHLWEREALAPPRRILEWGPGRSTLFFAETFPEAVIDGVEHHPRWFESCRLLEAAFGGVSMHHRRLAIAPGQADGYVTWPLYSDIAYDLIFIDGRLRCDCAAVAALVLAPGGVVLIHDAHRAAYHPAFAFFQDRRIVCDTAILRDPRSPWRR